MKYCTHESCRADTVQNLRWLAPLLGLERLIRAINVACEGEVRCRRVPRNGAVLAPFPGEEEEEDE
jgi:hypothetical protein